MFSKLLRIFIAISSLAGLFSYFPVKAQSGEQPPIFTFDDLGYQDIQLRGLYGSSTIWIPFQSNWVVDTIEVELTYKATSLLNEENAILTVKANDKEIASIRPIGDELEHSVIVRVLPDSNTPGGINLSIDGYLRLTDDTCEDSFNAGQWLIIRNSSRVRVNLKDNSQVPILADLPEAINVKGDINPPSIVFVLPESPSSVVMTTASQVAARLGMNMIPIRLPIEATTPSKLTNEQKTGANLVVIGTPQTMPLIWELRDIMPAPPSPDGFVSLDGYLVPPTDGVVQIFKSPWSQGRKILIVAGNGDEGLAMAGKSFADRSTYESFEGSFEFIHALVSRPVSFEGLPWTSSRTTFRQLGEFDRQITGIGITDSFYYFKAPPGVLYDEGSVLALHIAFSPALQEKNSFAVVYVNEIFVGSISIGATEGDSWVLLDLPSQAMNQVLLANQSKDLSVKISISNLVPTNNCEQIEKGVSWTKIYSDSYFQLKLVPVKMPDLFFFPYPFAGLTDGNAVQFILPDAPSATETQSLLTLSALIGNRMFQDTTFAVGRAGEISPEMLAGKDIILLGAIDRNPWIGQMLTSAGDNAPVDIYQKLNSPLSGYFHEIVSPWDASKTALAIYGNTDAEFNLAAESLFTDKELADRPGSIVLVREGAEKPVVLYRENTLNQPEAVFSDPVVAATPSPSSDSSGNVVSVTSSSDDGLTGTERVILIIAVTLVILVALVALVRLVWKPRS